MHHMLELQTLSTIAQRGYFVQRVTEITVWLNLAPKSSLNTLKRLLLRCQLGGSRTEPPAEPEVNDPERRGDEGTGAAQPGLRGDNETNHGES